MFHFIMTNHVTKDREDRMVAIAMNIGWGEKVLISSLSERNHLEQLTDAGVLLVTDRQGKVLITAYIPSMEKVVALYGGKVPEYVASIVKKANKKWFKIMKKK